MSTHHSTDPDLNDPDRIPEAEAIEPDHDAVEGTTEPVEILHPPESAPSMTPATKQTSRWLFWKRPSKRDLAIQQLSSGYVELIEMVRSIKDNMDASRETNVVLRDSLETLPEALNSLQSLGDAHNQVGEALHKINDQMEKGNEKDEKLANSMDGVSQTLKGMDDTNKSSIKTIDRVQERMRDSDVRMENLFNNVRQSEEMVGGMMMRLERRMFLSNIVFALCLLGALGGLLYFLLKGDHSFFSKKDPEATAPTTVLSTPAVEAGNGSTEDRVSEPIIPADPDIAPIEVAPKPAEVAPAPVEIAPEPVEAPRTPEDSVDELETVSAPVEEVTEVREAAKPLEETQATVEAQASDLEEADAKLQELEDLLKELEE